MPIPLIHQIFHPVNLMLCCSRRGDFSSMLRDFSAIIIGGSFSNVQDVEHEPWRRDIFLWLDLLRKFHNVPVLGICGGHQLMAHVLGGKVVKRVAGPIVGSVALNLSDEGKRCSMMQELCKGHFANYDIVSDSKDDFPAHWKVLARAAGSIAAVDYGSGWYGLQFHPELPLAFFQKLWGALGEPDHAARYEQRPLP